jgi:signal transduction histidine kinase
MASADTTRLRLILLNLVGKAIKLTAHGEVIVHVSASGNGQLRYDKHDTGIGMTSE